MAHSEVCPICKGEGKIKERICHGCGGSGWITVYDNDHTSYYPDFEKDKE